MERLRRLSRDLSLMYRTRVGGMVGFILFFRFATFYALERINYSTR